MGGGSSEVKDVAELAAVNEAALVLLVLRVAELEKKLEEHLGAPAKKSTTKAK